MGTLFCLITSLKSMFRDQRELALENLALRQQLAILAGLTAIAACEKGTGCSGFGSPDC
jgi:hypothetical protein